MKNYSRLQSETKVKVWNDFLASETMETLYYDNVSDLNDSTCEEIELTDYKEYHTYFKRELNDNGDNVVVGFTTSEVIMICEHEHFEEFKKWWEENQSEYKHEYNN